MQLLNINENGVQITIQKLADNLFELRFSTVGYGSITNHLNLTDAMLRLVKELKRFPELLERVQIWFNQQTQLPIWTN